MAVLRAAILLMLMIGGCEFVVRECPVGELVTKINGECPPNTYALFNDWTWYACCDDVSPCLNTGMISHYHYGLAYKGVIYRRHAARGQYNDNHIERYFAHEYNTTDRDWLCPVPVGYLWKNIYKMEMYPPFQKRYLPVDFKDMDDFDHKIKNCQKNEDCGEEEFCGDVINGSYEPEIAGKCSDGTSCGTSGSCSDGNCHFNFDRLTWADKIHKFCYKIPPMPMNDMTKMQYAMRSASSNLIFCNQHIDCDIQTNKGEYCHTTLERNGQKWTSYEPDPDPTKIGFRKHYDGLCMDAKPISFLLSELFDGLSDKLSIAAQKYLPVDMKHGDHFYLEKLNKCEKNSQCVQGSFCDESISLLESNNYIAKDRKYCYKGPEGLPANSHYVIVPDKISLIPCDSNSNCSVGTCHLDGTSTFAKILDNGTRKSFKGLCIEEEDSSSIIIWIIIVIISLILVILIAVAVFFVLRKLKNNKNSSSKTSEKTNKIIGSPSTPATNVGAGTSVSQNVA